MTTSSFRENSIGALLMTGSMAAFVINDAFMKSLSDHWPFFQALFVRSLVAGAILGLIAWYRGFQWGAFVGADWKLVAVRTVTEVAAAYFFISALFNMPIANITAIIQALPLTVTLAGALFLKESIGWRRMLAICIGAIGMFLIVRPGPEGFDTYAIYGLVAVVCVTIRDLAARRLNAKVPTMTVAFLTAVSIGTFAGIGSLFVDWAPITVNSTVLVGSAAIFVIGGYIFSIQVMRQGDIAFVAPFRYTSLLWALVLGWLVWGEWPDVLTMFGALIIVITGIFSFWREHRALKT